MHEISMCFEFSKCEIRNKIDRSVHKGKLIKLGKDFSKRRFGAKYEQNSLCF